MVEQNPQDRLFDPQDWALDDDNLGAEHIATGPSRIDDEESSDG